jgi:hypothetical protein
LSAEFDAGAPNQNPRRNLPPAKRIRTDVRAAVSSPRWWFARVADWWCERSRMPSVIVGNGLTVAAILAGLLVFHLPALFSLISGYVIGDLPWVWSAREAIRRWDGDRYAKSAAWWVRERHPDYGSVYRDGMRHHSIEAATTAAELGRGRFAFVDRSELFQAGSRVVVNADARVTHQGWRPSLYRIEHSTGGLNVVARSKLRRVAVPAVQAGSPPPGMRLIAVASVTSSVPLLLRAKPKVTSKAWWSKQVGDWFFERSRVPSTVIGNSVTLTAALAGATVGDLSTAAAIVSGWVVGQIPSAWSLLASLKHGRQRYSSPAAYWEEKNHEGASREPVPNAFRARIGGGCRTVVPRRLRRQHSARDAGLR